MHANSTSPDRVLASTFGQQSALFTSSGAAACVAALIAAGLEPGDEVILSSVLCSRMGRAVLALGGVPVFVDTGPEAVLTSSRVRAAITNRTRVVIAAHQYGIPCDVDGIASVLPSGTVVIEDVAQAIGGEFDGRQVGARAPLAVVSLNAGKPIDFGWGGAVLSSSDSIDHLRSSLDARALAHSTVVDHVPPHVFGGIDHVLARVQTSVRARREAALRVIEGLTSMHMQLPVIPQESEPSWFRIPVWPSEDGRSDALVELKRLGFDAVAPHQVPNPLLPQFAGRSRHISDGDHEAPVVIRAWREQCDETRAYRIGGGPESG